MNRKVIILLAALSWNACIRDNNFIEREIYREKKKNPDRLYYDSPREENPILYTTFFEHNTCLINQVGIKKGIPSNVIKVSQEKSSSATIHAAFDPECGYLFITDQSTRELWLNMLPGVCHPYCCGTLAGPAVCACCLNGDFYYVNNSIHTLNAVRFSGQWMITEEIVLDTLPKVFKPEAMVISPALDYIYFSGRNKMKKYELIAWSIYDSSFCETNIMLDKNDKITFGSDNQLYAVSSDAPLHLTPLFPYPLIP